LLRTNIPLLVKSKFNSGANYLLLAYIRANMCNRSTFSPLFFIPWI
jgi:hypothetical protein